MEFLEAVASYPFLQYAVLAGILASISCGIVGTLVVVRRISYIAGSIAHCVLGGMGVAIYLEKSRGWTFVDPLHGAIVAALGSAMIIGWVSLYLKEREDTTIAALWAIGMAVGILFLSQTPGYQEDLMSYLFGNLLLVTREKLWLLLGLDAFCVAVSLLFYHHLQAICFDEEFSRVRGSPVTLYYLLLLCMTAVTVVLLSTVVGIVMVIALLCIPVSIASIWFRRIWQIMLVSACVTIAITFLGLGLSYGPDLPSGATIIILLGTTYLLAATAARTLSYLSHLRKEAEFIQAD